MKLKYSREKCSLLSVLKTTFFRRGNCKVCTIKGFKISWFFQVDLIKDEEKLLLNHCSESSCWGWSLKDCLKFIVKSWIYFSKIGEPTKIKFGITYSERNHELSRFCFNWWKTSHEKRMFFFGIPDGFAIVKVFSCILLVLSTYIEHLNNHRMFCYFKNTNWCTAIREKNNFQPARRIWISFVLRVIIQTIKPACLTYNIGHFRSVFSNYKFSFRLWKFFTVVIMWFWGFWL